MDMLLGLIKLEQMVISLYIRIKNTLEEADFARENGSFLEITFRKGDNGTILQTVMF